MTLDTRLINDAQGIARKMLTGVYGDNLDLNIPLANTGMTLRELIPLGYFGDNILANYKFGKNDTVGNSAFEFIWDGGNGYNGFFSTAVAMEIVSNSSSDDDGSTGAWTVTVAGLDANWELAEETVTMNGTTPVPIPGTWLRINRAYVVAGGTPAGITTANVGTISIREIATPANIAAQINPGNGQTLMLIYTIPAGYYGLILNADANCGKGDEATVKFLSRNCNTASCPFTTKAERQIYEGSFTRVYSSARKVDEKTDVCMAAKNEIVGDMRVTGSFEILLIKKTFLEGV